MTVQEYFPVRANGSLPSQRLLPVDPVFSTSPRVMTLNASTVLEGCPVGWFYTVDYTSGEEQCTECLNSARQEYPYCPGDNRMYLCNNGPWGVAAYIAQGLGWSSPNCSFLCLNVREVRSNDDCVPCPISQYPVNPNHCGPCTVPPSLQNNDWFSPFVRMLSNGISESSGTCDVGLTRAVMTVGQAPSSLRWCGLDTTGPFGLYKSASLYHQKMYQRNGRLPGPFAVELVSVWPHGWSLILSVIAYNAVTKRLTAQLWFNCSTTFATFSSQFQLTASVMEETVAELSVDLQAALLVFMVNGALAGTPEPTPSAGDTRLPCTTTTPQRLYLGGWRAQYQTTMTAYLLNGQFATLPTMFTFLPGILRQFSTKAVPFTGQEVLAQQPRPRLPVARRRQSEGLSALSSYVVANTTDAIAMSHLVVALFQSETEEWSEQSTSTQCRDGLYRVVTAPVALSCRAVTSLLPRLSIQSCCCTSLREIRSSSCALLYKNFGVPVFVPSLTSLPQVPLDESQMWLKACLSAPFSTGQCRWTCS